MRAWYDRPEMRPGERFERRNPEVRTEPPQAAPAALDPKRMEALQAAVIGVGALGEAVVRLLGMEGAGRLLLVDPDRVERSNLSRSVLYREPGAVGTVKVEAAARAGRRLFPATTFEPHAVAVADMPTADLAEADVIFGCLDSEAARVQLAFLAAKLDRPVVDGGLSAPGAGVGRVSWFPSREQACFCCGLRHSRRRDLLETFDSAPRSCSDREVEGAAAGSTATQAAIIAALQIEVGLLGGAKSYALEMDADYAVSRHDLPRARLCPFHEAPGALVEGEEAETFGEILARSRVGAPRAVVLDWPVAAPGGVGGEVLRRIEDASPWVNRRPRDLGLRGRRIYTVESLGPAQ